MFGNGKDVEFVVHDDAVHIFTEGKEEPFVESGFDFAKGFSSVALMGVHDKSVELFQAGHGFEQKDDQSSAFNGLYGSAEQVWCQSFEILKYQHLIGVTEDFVTLLVVSVSDFCAGDKEFERIVDLFVIQAFHLHVFDLFHTLLLVRAELQVVLVAPKNFRFLVVG